MAVHVELGDSIRGELISGDAMKIAPPRVKRDDQRLKETTLERENAFCVVEVPLRLGEPSPREYLSIGDAVKADKIHGEAIEIDQPIKFRRTGAHQGQKTRLRGSAFCIVELPLRWVVQRVAKSKKS